MKKLFVLMTTVIIIICSLMITPAEISASDYAFKPKEDNPYKFFLVSHQFISNDYKKHWFPYVTDTKYDDYFKE